MHQGVGDRVESAPLFSPCRVEGVCVNTAGRLLHQGVGDGWSVHLLGGGGVYCVLYSRDGESLPLPQDSAFVLWTLWTLKCTTERNCAGGVHQKVTTEVRVEERGGGRGWCTLYNYICQRENSDDV